MRFLKIQWRGLLRFPQKDWIRQGPYVYQEAQAVQMMEYMETCRYCKSGSFPKILGGNIQAGKFQRSLGWCLKFRRKISCSDSCDRFSLDNKYREKGWI